ncbi:MAG: LamG-like jellyroll fold domain-containing protein [Bacteroidota bacterium]
MSLRIGNSEVLKAFIGNVEASKVYLGDVLILGGGPSTYNEVLENTVAGLPDFTWRLNGSLAEEGGALVSSSGTIGYTSGIIPTLPDQAWQSNGSAFINPENSPDINTDTATEKRCISLWFRATNTGGWQNIYEQGGGTHGWHIGLYDDYLTFNITNNGDARNSIQHQIVEDRIYHVVVVFDLSDQVSASNMEMFVNGVSVGVDKFTTQNFLNSHTGDIQFGGTADGRTISGDSGSKTPTDFVGQLQRIDYWSEKDLLTEADALAIYSFGMGPNQAPSISSIAVNVNSGIYTGSYVYEDAEGDLEDGPLPVASGVSFAGLLADAETLTSSYGYDSLNNVAEGTSMFRWYLADDQAGANEVQVATTSNYIIDNADVGKHVDFGVIPVDANGNTGLEVRVGYSASTIQNALVQKRALFAFGSGGNTTSGTSPDINGDYWNTLFTNNPDGSYSATGFVDSDNNPIPFTINVVLAMSDQGGNFGLLTGNNSGPFPDVATREFWTVPGSSGTVRGFDIEDLNNAIQYSARALCSTNFSGSGGVHDMSLSFGGESIAIPSARNNTSVTEFSAKSPSTGKIAVRVTKGGGFAPLNCLELIWFE